MSETILERKCYFQIDSTSENTHYRCWVRGTKIEQGQLWELELKRPKFSVEAIDGKESNLQIALNAQGQPETLLTPDGELKVWYARERESPIEQSNFRSTSATSTAVPTEFQALVAPVLNSREQILWWGLPGPRARVIALIWLTFGLLALGTFGYLWLGLGGLCLYSTPAEWQIPCGMIFGFGVLFISVPGWFGLKAVRKVIQIRPIYLVTDQRVLIVAAGEQLVAYQPWEIRYARIRRRGEGGDVYFPTQNVRNGNLWSIENLQSLERELSVLLSS